MRVLRAVYASAPKVRWVLGPRSKAAKDILVRVNLARFDALWKKDTGGYLDPNDPGLRTRRAKMLQHLTSAPQVDLYASEVYYDANRDWITFVDGRHRVAVLRELGATEIAVAVRHDNLAEFLAATGGRKVGSSVVL